MLKHLTYTITRGYKVGYGALFTKIFKDFDVDVSEEPIIIPRVENILGPACMKLLRLKVVNGKAVGLDDGPAAEEEDETEEVSVEKQKGTRKKQEKTGKETKKRRVSFKRKRTTTPTTTGTRTSKRVKRVAKKSSHRVPIEIVDDDTETVSTPHQGETNAPGSGSKAQEQGEPSGEPVQQDSMLQMLLQQVQALETTQTSFINDTKASFATLQSQLAGLHTALQETRTALIDKVDSIIVEEVTIDPSS